ncbi:hypothetical protein TrVFT333_006457 [Trichoderma virens FT-333]|nr:hypothetical protein TrVFT333_006457 [Trichoderma virens FT-333]
MSLPDCDPTEGAFQEHPWNIDTPRQHKKGNITEASWEELDQSIPDCDEQLKTLREDFFDTEPRMIKLALEALEPLLEPEFGVTTSDSTEKLGNIRRIIILAEHAVVLEFIQQKERSYSYHR